MKQKNKVAVSILLLILIGAWFVMPTHLRMALIYWFPGINDYTIFDNREVEASDEPFEWPTSEKIGENSLPQNARDTLNHYESIAFLVIQNDSVIYEEYWDDYNSASLTNSFSVAKSIVSLLIGIAIDEGSIRSVDQKVGDFIPHLAEGEGDKLTIRHLLTMSSGSNWDESYSSPLSMTTKAYYGDDLTGLLSDMHIVETPGVTFDYKSGDTQLLAEIVRKATGKSLGQYASEKLWQPLGAKHAAQWSLDHNDGHEKAYCCFNSNARDFALLGALLNHKGHWNNRQIISENYLLEATSAATNLQTKQGKELDYYGFQYWIVTHNGIHYPYARGILGQYIISLPDKNGVIVRLGHKRSTAKINNHPSDVYAYLQMGLDLMN